MAYLSSHHHVSSRPRVWRTVVLCVVLVAVFGVSVYAFRRMAATEAARRDQKTAESGNTIVLPLVPVVEAATVDLVDVENGSGRGQAARDVKDGRVHIAMRASLPPIDRTSVSYEAWLVSRLPFDYAPMGELVTDEGGTFILGWEGDAGKDYGTYRQVIITRQAKAARVDPGTHVLEGKFGD